MKSLFFLICTFTVTANAGGMDSGGGSGYAAEFTEYSYQALKLIENNKSFPVSAKKFSTTIRNTKIEFTEKRLFDRTGNEVDALNYPGRRLIKVNQLRWFNLFLAPKFRLQLVVHELLGILRIDDTGYKVSRLILETGIKTKALACNWSDSGFSGTITWYQLSYGIDGTPDETKAHSLIKADAVPNFAFEAEPVVTLSFDNSGMFVLAIVWQGPILYSTSILLDKLEEKESTFESDFFSSVKFGSNGPIFEKAGKMDCKLQSSL